MARIKIMKYLAEHLKKIDGLAYERWTAGDIDSDRLPHIDVRDRINSFDSDSGHILHIEIELKTKVKARAESIDETLALMQSISHAVRDAVEEMKISGKLSKNEIDAEKSEFKFIGALLKFDLIYTADEWSV